MTLAEAPVAVTPFYADDWLTVYGGDCRDVLATLPAESIDCIVTSPPYWGLRDYGTDGQLGLEATPEEYVDNLVAVFRELRRVLTTTGTCWLNLGDAYAGSWGAQSRGNRTGDDKTTLNGHDGGLRLSGRQIEQHARFNLTGTRALAAGRKPKDLIGLPWMVAFALRTDGWWLRSDIVWSKPNPMPESVTDRPTKSHEYLFLLTKAERYYFDADAIREPGVTTRPDLLEFGERPDLGFPGHSKDRRRARDAAPNGPVRSPHGQGFTRRSDKQGSGQQITGGDRYTGFNDRWDAAQDAGTAPLTRNVRSVWTIPTSPYPGAHFAVFPPEVRYQPAGYDTFWGNRVYRKEEQCPRSRSLGWLFGHTVRSDRYPFRADWFGHTDTTIPTDWAAPASVGDER